MAEYRIVHNEFFSEGKLDVSYYTVETSHKTWLGKVKWKSFTTEKIYGNGLRRVPIRFNVIEEAKEFIELQKKGNPIDGKRVSVVHLDSDEPMWETIAKL